MAKLKASLLAIISTLLLIIIFQNTTEATVRLLFVKVTMPLALLLGIMILCGTIIGWLTSLWIFRQGPSKPN